MMVNNREYNDIYEMCKQHMHSYVLIETTDGMQTDGIITGVDNENVYVAVPVDQNEQMQGNPSENPNQFGRNPYPPYGRPGYGFRPGYGYGRPGYRGPGRFRRLAIPLSFIAALSLLPWY